MNSLLTRPRKLEKKVTRFWEDNEIYQKVKKLRKGSKKFFFVDGPPYPTGIIGVHTSFNKLLKDMYIRFFRMLGYDVWDQPGYDTHGLPIENQVEKKLGFKRKSDIERYGIEKFIKECRKFATKYIGLMSKQFKDLGVWMDWENPYLTLTNDYIEGAWAVFKEGYKKGLLFKGSYPVHVCPRCETAVAYNEIEYKDVEDPSIYVKLKVKENEYLLIWTTTPWTLAANTGVMAKPGVEYVKIKIEAEVLVLAKKLLDVVLEKAGIENYKVLETLKGEELAELRYEPLLADLFPFQKELENAHRVVLSDRYVALDEGTGLVHTAPGHGKEDYEVGLENKLPAPSPVRIDGTYNDQCGKFSGMKVRDADKLIIEELERRGLLFHQEKITHEYPFCWRCGSPLLLISIPQWFFKITEIRDRLIDENKKVAWTPEWAKKRFNNWLESLGDWPISRQRYWGIPLPIWICECGATKVIGLTEELDEIPKDLHRPYIDKVRLKCKCGKLMKRVPDVLDVWFDSGVASWASLGYPRNKKLWREWWPADLNIEGPDQIRGWWNSQLITSVIAFDRVPFKRILYHEFMLDAKGHPMSKSRGNIIMPAEVLERYSKDSLRCYLLSKPPWRELYFKWDELAEVSKKLNILRNTLRFVKVYVTEYEKSELKLEDKWILSRLNSLIKEWRAEFEQLHGHEAIQEILEFVIEDLSHWYIKLVRDRTWPRYKGKDKQAAFYTLVTVTENLAKILAPVCPFIAEETYQEIVKPLKGSTIESVHMHKFPEPDAEMIDLDLEKSMEMAREVVESVLSLRQKNNLKLKWPIKKVTVATKDENAKKAIQRLEEIILRMANVKKVEVRTKMEGFGEKISFGKVYLDTERTPELIEEAFVNELMRQIQKLRKKHKFNVREKIELWLKPKQAETEITLRKFETQIKERVGAKEVRVGKIKGKYRGKCKALNREVEIGFGRVA